jgi:tRNA(fMet)-specific endonuclease VapC
MSGRYLLDTNIVIALFVQDNAIMNSLGGAEEVFIPSIVVGELYYGALKSGRVTENIVRLDQFVAANTVLSCDVDTARWYGKIKNDLRQKGRPIPENDIWITALALQHDLLLVTRDRHFSEAEGLKIEVW